LHRGSVRRVRHGGRQHRRRLRHGHRQDVGQGAATMRFIFEGELPPYLMAKDLILAAIGDIGCDGATYRAMEFDGGGVYSLNIEERMTLCNMVIEAGGKNGVIAPDQVTLDYVNARNAGQKPYTVVKSDPD